MNTTVKNQGWGPWHVIALILVLIIAVGAFASYFHLTLSIANITSNGQLNTTTKSIGACPTTGLTSTLTQASYLNAVKTVTQVSTGATLYYQGGTTSVASAATLTSGTNSISVPCGSNVWIYYGDGTSYYQDPTPVTSVGQSAQFQLYATSIKPMATLSQITFFNGTAYTATYAEYPVLGNGASKSVPITVQAGNGYYGDTQIEIVAAFNATEYPASSLTATAYNGGPSPVPATVVLPTSVSANVLVGYQTKAWTIPAISFSNSTTFYLNFQTGTLNTNAVVANPIQIMFKDSSNFLNNGAITPNQFANPLTGASIGLTTYQLGTLSNAVTSGAAASNIWSTGIVAYS